MATPRKKSREEIWRDEIVRADDFACACGCALRLSRGQLADAIRLAAVFNGGPRTYGVVYAKSTTQESARREHIEPAERQLCRGCRTSVVEIPAFAANLLRERDADWPTCSSCRDGGRR